MLHWLAQDFAGQVVYYVSHQLFLASRSLFVLVWDLTEDPDLEFWLCSIRSRAGEKAPIIIVATHLDRFIEMASQEAQVSYPSPIIDQKVEQKLNLARETYQLEFPQIVDFFAVSCASGQNLSHVTRKIQETALEQEYMPEKVYLFISFFILLLFFQFQFFIYILLYINYTPPQKSKYYFLSIFFFLK